MTKDQRPQVLLFLLLGALLISAGLNFYLLLADHRVLTMTDAEVDSRVTESEMELRLAQRQLARCQSEQLRKDSLLVNLLHQAETVTTTY